MPTRLVLSRTVGIERDHLAASGLNGLSAVQLVGESSFLLDWPARVIDRDEGRSSVIDTRGRVAHR